MGKSFVACQIIVILLLSACSGRKGTAIEGKFKNISEAECYIFSQQSGQARFDTVRLHKGRFRYEVDVPDTTVLTLQYPNFMQLHIVVPPGKTQKIEGDAADLRTTRVRGCEDNELLTDLRLRMLDKGAGEREQMVEEFIRSYPAALASQVVFERYMLMAEEVDYDACRHLLRRMVEAAPDRMSLRLLNARVSPRLNTAPGKKMPRFEYFTTDSVAVTGSTFEGSPYIVWFWSTWRPEMSSPVRASRDLYRSREGRLRQLNICLDTDTAEFCRQLRKDPLPDLNVCDRRGWDTPLVQDLGIQALPVAVLVDKDGCIVARDLDKDALQTEVEKLLPKT